MIIENPASDTSSADASPSAAQPPAEAPTPRCTFDTRAVAREVFERTVHPAIADKVTFDGVFAQLTARLTKEEMRVHAVLEEPEYRRFVKSYVHGLNGLELIGLAEAESNKGDALRRAFYVELEERTGTPINAALSWLNAENGTLDVSVRRKNEPSSRRAMQDLIDAIAGKRREA